MFRFHDGPSVGKERGKLIFVTNRFVEIGHPNETQSWKHIAASINIANILSRGCTCLKRISEFLAKGP